MENEGEEKSGEKGKDNTEMKKEEEGKATGKRENSTGMKGTQGKYRVCVRSRIQRKDK